jgi:hypothetical protein
MLTTGDHMQRQQPGDRFPELSGGGCAGYDHYPHRRLCAFGFA